MPKLNIAYLVTVVLLVVCLAMMIAACVLPNWSKSDTVRAGLWEACVSDTSATNSGCQSLDDEINSNAAMVAAKVTAIWSTIMIAVGLCWAILALLMNKKFIGFVLCCQMIQTFIMNCVAWGSWIGVHNDYFKDLGLKPDASFILCCITSAFLFLCICLSIWGMFLAGKAKKAEAAEKQPDKPPGMSDEEAQEFEKMDGQPLNDVEGYPRDAPDGNGDSRRQSMRSDNRRPSEPMHSEARRMSEPRRPSGPPADSRRFSDNRRPSEPINHNQRPPREPVYYNHRPPPVSSYDRPNSRDEDSAHPLSGSPSGSPSRVYQGSKSGYPFYPTYPRGPTMDV